MLQPVTRKNLKSKHGRFAIVASRYNSKYVDAMLKAAKAEFSRAGTSEITVVRVPGAFEIPVIASRLAHQGNIEAIVCLGVILRGETTHAAHIGEAVTQALMQIQVSCRVPVIHEVLLLENEQQARVRCLGGRHNRGAEAAQTALAMAKLMAVTRR